MKLFTMMKEIARNTVCGPVTRNYPAVKRPPFPGERGKLVMEEGKCIFCGIWRKEMPVSCPDRDPQAGAVVEGSSVSAVFFAEAVSKPARRNVCTLSHGSNRKTSRG